MCSLFTHELFIGENVLKESLSCLPILGTIQSTGKVTIQTERIKYLISELLNSKFTTSPQESSVLSILFLYVQNLLDSLMSNSSGCGISLPTILSKDDLNMPFAARIADSSYQFYPLKTPIVEKPTSSSSSRPVI